MAKILFFFSCWSRVYETVLDLWAFWLFQFFITNCLGKWCLKIFFRKRSLGQKLLSMLICREMNQLQWQHRCWGLSPHPHPEFQKLYPGPALVRPEEQIYFRTFCTKSRRWGLGWSDFCCSLLCWMEPHRCLTWYLWAITGHFSIRLFCLFSHGLWTWVQWELNSNSTCVLDFNCPIICFLSLSKTCGFAEFMGHLCSFAHLNLLDLVNMRPYFLQVVNLALLWWAERLILFFHSCVLKEHLLFLCEE